MSPAEKIPGTYHKGEWVGSTACLDFWRRAKSLFLLGTQPQIIQPPYTADCTSCMATANKHL